MDSKELLRFTIALILACQLVAGITTPVYAGTTGIVSGTVTDSETGEKLVGVNVIVKGTDLTTVTDENGYYVITNVPPGDYEVVCSLIGYTDAETRGVSVLMDVTTPVDVGMTPSVTEEENVIVAESKPTVRRDVVPTMYVVDDTQEQMLRSHPNSMYQTPAVVLTQPGVIADEQGYPHIRGGRGTQVGYLLDGIPTTETLTNAFGTNCITVGMDEMEIYTGGYRPEYGNAVSGVFNQIVKTGQTAPGLSMEAIGGGQSFQGVYPQIGGCTDTGLDYYVGAYLWSSDLEGLDYNEVDSADAIGKFSYPLGEKDKLTLLTTSGTAKYQFPYVHTETYGPDGLQTIGEERDHNHQSYLLHALTWNHTISPSSFFTVRPYYFRSRNKVDALSDPFAGGIGFWWDSESSTNGLQVDYTNQISQRHLLKAGAIRTDSNNRYWVTVPSFGTYEYTANTDTVQTGAYIQDQMRLSPRWGAEAGLRYDRIHYDKVANTDASESQWSPRFGVSYAVDPRTNLRFSYGKMIQFVHTQAIERNYTDPIWDAFYGLTNADLRPERSTQYDLGWERQIDDDYSVQVTPFYRKFVDLLQIRSLNPGDPTAPPYVYDNLGEGTSKGVELLVRKRPSKNWSGWLSYTYSTAKAQSSNPGGMVTPGVTHYVDWDQRHTAVLVLNYFNRGWSYSLMAEYGSGLPYNLTGEDPNCRRVSSRTLFNVNISREVRGGWLPDGEIRLGIANLLNTNAVLDRGPDGEPTASVAPRFINLSYTRRH